jgi:uncharacterized repeat protein (TIGR03803 family)
MRSLSGKMLISSVLALSALTAFSGPVEAQGNVSVVYSFQGGRGGQFPDTGLIEDGSGNLIGGAAGGKYNGGVMFQISPAGAETVLHSFGNTGDGNDPVGGLIADSQGNIYGATYLGGPGGYGTVFRRTAGGAYKVLYSFSGGADGGYPSGTLTRDSTGNLFGTADAGPNGVGIVFRVGAAGRKSTLYAFTGGTDGGRPDYAHLVLDSQGDLYGTASQGGANNQGVIFKLTPRGKETVLHSFTRADGAAPEAGLIADAAGNFYGTTSGGGANLAGAVFKCTPRGKLTVLYSFAGGSDGSDPVAGVILDKAGDLYGTTSAGGDSNDGTVFGLSPGGTRILSASLKRARTGAPPNGSLALDPAGTLYGTAYYGGAKGQSDGGTVFKVNN